MRRSFDFYKYDLVGELAKQISKAPKQKTNESVIRL